MSGKSKRINPEGRTKETEPKPRPLPEIIDALHLTSTPPPKPAEVVHGLIHRSCKLVIGGTSKSFKTWSLIDLALSVASGKEFWGFPTTKGRVLYINFEIGSGFFADRINKVMQASNKYPAAGDLLAWNLRGHSAGLEDLRAEIEKRCEGQDFSLIVFDPVYKVLGNRDENKAGDIASLLNEFERIAVATGAAIAFGAHFSKGNQAGKEAMDRIGGSGVYARDPDAILTMTKHQQDGSFTVDATLRNHTTPEPFTVTWEFPLLKRSDLNPDELKEAKPRGPKPTYTADALLKVLVEHKELSATEWMRAAKEEEGLSESSFWKLKRELEGQKKVIQSKITKTFMPK